MIISEFKVFHDPDWKKFLRELPNQEAKDLACKTMGWIKDKYADVINRNWEMIKKMNVLQDNLETSLGRGLKGSPLGYTEVIDFHKGIINKIQNLQQDFGAAISGKLIAFSKKED